MSGSTSESATSTTSLARSSAVMASGTLVSRILGLLRMALLAWAIGVITPAAPGTSVRLVRARQRPGPCTVFHGWLGYSISQLHPPPTFHIYPRLRDLFCAHTFACDNENDRDVPFISFYENLPNMNPEWYVASAQLPAPPFPSPRLWEELLKNFC